MIRSPFAYLAPEERIVIEREATMAGRGIAPAVGISADTEQQGDFPP
jgi:hypothetical protein